MVSATSKVTGLDHVRAAMAKAPAAARAAMAAGIEEMARRAADDIRQSLASEVPDAADRIADAVSVGPEPDGTGVRLTVDLPFAAALEFGTRQAVARPFLRPAAAQAAQGAADILAPRLAEILKPEQQ